MKKKEYEMEKDEGDMFDDKLVALKHIFESHHKLKEDIGSDFVLAKLEGKTGQNDKEFVSEMTDNAYFAKRIIDNLVEKAKEYKKYKQEFTRKQYEEEIETAINKSKDTFTQIMTRVLMVTTLNRNVSKNYILKLMEAEATKDENEEEEQARKAIEKEIADKVKENKEK